MTKESFRKKLFWGILFFLIAIFNIKMIIKINKCFSLHMFVEFVKDTNFWWILLALLLMFLYVMFEGWSIVAICKSFNHKFKKRDALVYAASDIYFSAITPSASGGQPASAYFMVKDGVSASVTTLALLYTLLMYVVSIVILNIITFLINPNIFFSFNFGAQLIIILGFFSQIVLMVVFYLLLYKDKFLSKICNFFLNLLYKIHLIKNIDTKKDKLNKVMESYQKSAKMVKGKRKLLFKVLIFNLLQKICQIGVIIVVYLATFGTPENIFNIWSIECLVIIGAYCVPVPGGMGITDYLMLQGFKNIMSVEQAVNLELLSRGLSFYICVVSCGIIALIRYVILKRSNKI